MTLLSVVVAGRGVLELVLWLFIGRFILVMLAGKYGIDNAVIRMFDFLLRPVRVVASWLMTGCRTGRRDTVCFMLLLLVWFGLGMAKLALAYD